ncbi:hypothetical protein RHSIM_Rhsim05G0138800 [Rhododendron simsii]|uniref:Uncharacterized protein n=1 Tax=Rhododendron simsii TaxID=118357 RepID=A0A834LNB8_RHOSS|nr:hypothetical protein RHSIM_Rhsim05G0138800 [Rhododendron simsii]
MVDAVINRSIYGMFWYIQDSTSLLETAPGHPSYGCTSSRMYPSEVSQCKEKKRFLSSNIVFFALLLPDFPVQLPDIPVLDKSSMQRDKV